MSRYKRVQNTGVIRGRREDKGGKNPDGALSIAEVQVINHIH